MIDFFLAMMAAGINSADGAGTGDAATAQVMPPAIVEPVTPPAAVTETVPPEAVPSAPIGDTLATLAPAPVPAPETPSADVNLGASVIIGQGLLEGVPAAQAGAPQVAPAPPTPATPGMNRAVVPAGLAAEPQKPTGKFTTAAEVKPILTATKGNWVAVRAYNGQDILYVTHIWSWRCGLHAMAISVNDEPMQNWPLPPCHMKHATPSAILEEDGLPYLTLKEGSVRTIDIQIVYDDLSMDVATFERDNILIP
tara:strand:+ start:4793 stop:5551 length:759 start_codon:yes stop_codon:yes gene_type:complete